MIVQALVKRYEDTQEIPPGWQKRGASYALNLSENGELIGFPLLEQEDPDRKKMMRQLFVLPTEPAGRTSGVKAAFLCDNGGYLCGLDPKRGEEKFRAAGRLHLQVLENVDTPAAKAVKAYFAGEKPSDIPDYITGNTVCVFQVNGRYAHEDEQIRRAWDANHSGDTEGSGEMIRCLVTGKMDTPEPLHTKIKLRGGQSTGSSLISANAESFASYGKTAKDRAADVGKFAAFAYPTALNEMLASDKHRQFVGTDTLTYWAETDGESEAAAFGWFFQPQEDDAEKLSAIMERVAKGSHIEIENCDMTRRFYLLCLSPNAGRISVRFFHVDAFGSILENIAAHYRNLEITLPQFAKFRYAPPWLLLGETTVKKKAADAAPLIGGQLTHSILSGAVYPLTLYNAILLRVKAGEDVNAVKAAIVKATLIRNYHESEVATVSLNEQSGNKPYVLGRLFSVLEQLQQRASGGSLNATIRDRYFATACSNPKNVFPTLLKLSMHHAAKLDDAGTYHEILKTRLLGRLDEQEPFPAALSMDDQGRFILGYYHQTQDFFTSKKDKENNQEKENQEGINHV
ncbi:MAG: type I-C CRISPR-associated protein Cas8c/Csd1 [Clostridiales bacterium]|jgi:CRISPR-associated protein Csd1|nr:type I-C CRISPR-associated protein Cas8c/Csd1 [Clostridiales bacterium]